MDADCHERWAAHRREHELEERLRLGLQEAQDRRDHAVDQALADLQQIQARYLYRTTYEMAHEDLRKRIDSIEQARANLEGRFWALGVGLGLLSVGVNLGLHWLLPK